MEHFTVILYFTFLFGCDRLLFVTAFTNADKKVIDTSQKKCSFNCYGHVQTNCLESLESCNLIVNIPCAHRCDGDSDCPNGADEKNCTVTTDSYPKDNGIDDGKMAWLKTTVYTVIVCTVGIVLLISVVVIGICRMKMKRAAIRRSLRQAERRRNHSHHNCEGHESRSRRSEHIEHEPFISAPSPTHFGNIIVNVNNGVQYVPSSDFTTAVQSPPSYSDVLAESGIVGRHSPPPEYSTIDRNPNNRVTQSPSENVNMQIVSANTTVNNERSVDASQRLSTPNGGCNDPVGLQYSVSMEEENPTNLTQTTACANDSVTVQGTQSLGRRPPREQRSQRERNVREVASPRRPKQLKVCDGQIVLDDNSSNSSSPETVNRNTQTNIADISNTCQNVAKPGQLQVLGGQIILSNQETEPSISGDRNSVTDGAVAQGQLDVKDGHIVFKSSGS